MGEFTKEQPFVRDTLANLQGLGTNDDIAVGDPAWDETGLRMLYCLTATATSSTWAYKTTATHRFEYSHDGLTVVFVPWTGIAEQTTSALGFVSLDLRYAGRVLGLVVTQNTGTPIDETAFGIHLGVAGAAPGAAAESITLDVAALDASETGDFTDATAFDAGARLALSVDVETDPVDGLVQGMLTLEQIVVAA